MSKWSKVGKLTKLSASQDAFSTMDITALPARRFRRSVWNVEAEEWERSIVMVKMEAEEFARGAQRACFRAKEMDADQFLLLPDWKKAANVVVKEYMTDVDRQVYEEDVKMQMLAKNFGEKYNLKGPPKKVGFMLTYVLEELNEDDAPGKIYCGEHFLEGKYEKYNSNSGYVRASDDESGTIRNTPHAFSHFTFLESQRSMIVVDIQGVSDLYTDPQIHTLAGTDYGQGNLGIAGMALFFNTHQCNPLCSSLGLTEFRRYHLARFELAQEWASSTLSRTFEDLRILAERPRRTVKDLPQASPSRAHPLTMLDLQNSVLDVSALWPSQDQLLSRGRQEAAAVPSETNIEETLAQRQRLGLIYLQTSRFHETGRLSEDGQTPDPRAAFYYLQQAAASGVLSALMALARVYSGLPRDVLPELELEDQKSCFQCMYRAAMLHKHPYAAFHTANMMLEGRGTEKNAKEGAEWLRLVLNYLYEHGGEITKAAGEESEVDFYGYEEPLATHKIGQKLAELYERGGDGLVQDKQVAIELYRDAAEAAMEAMLGKLSMKLYAAADELEASMEG